MSHPTNQNGAEKDVPPKRDPSKDVEGEGEGEENFEDLPERECKKQYLYNIFLFFVVLFYGGLQLYLVATVLGVSSDLDRLAAAAAAILSKIQPHFTCSMHACRLILSETCKIQRSRIAAAILIEFELNLNLSAVQ